MVQINDYTPKKIDFPKLSSEPTAWGHIPMIILDIIERFNIQRRRALEFGVEYGYSTSALANYFDKVIGVDTFIGDIHTSIRNNFFKETKNNLSNYPNIELIESDYKDFIRNHEQNYDLIHVDIIHTYDDTFECGNWALSHSNLVIFHDTETFTSVRQACIDLTEEYNLTFYNYKHCCGLGILVRD